MKCNSVNIKDIYLLKSVDTSLIISSWNLVLHLHTFTGWIWGRLHSFMLQYWKTF